MMMIKAHYHFDYLKKTGENFKPNSYLDSYNYTTNYERFYLLFPYFIKKRSNDNPEINRLEKRTKLFRNLTIANFLTIMTYWIVMIILIGE